MTNKTKLLSVAALLFVCAAAFFLNTPELVPAVAIPAFAWWAWQVYRVNAFGVALTGVTLELITAVASIVYHSEGSIFDLMWFEILLCLAIGSMLISVAIFLVRAWLSTPERRKNLLAGALACLLPVLWFCFGPWAAGSLAEWRLQREIANSGLPQLISELNTVTEHLGRAPKNEAEVVKLLGKPIPEISRGKIHYVALGGKHYALGFGDDMGCYDFDSREPGQGWQWKP
jgi:hypothetical protein